MASKSNKFARPPPDSSDRVPPLAVRYFYGFPKIPQLPIDDPLAPVPPATATTVTLKQPPSPFSDSDNIAIEKLWNDVRRRIRVQQERQRRDSIRLSKEAGEDAIGSLTSPARRQNESKSRRRSHGLEESSQRPTNRHLQLLSPGRSDGQAKDEDKDSVALDSRRSSMSGSLKGDPGADDRSGTTGNPFIRASSRSRKPRLPGDAESNIYSAPSRPQSSRLSTKSPVTNEEKEKPKSDVSAKLPVGVSQLHQVRLPDLV